MNRDVRRHIEEIDDLTVKLADLRLGERQVSTSYRIVDTLNQLQEHNRALGMPRYLKKMHHSRATSYAEGQAEVSELDFTRFGAMAGGYLASGYYMKLGFSWILTRLFGRPAS